MIDFQNDINEKFIQMKCMCDTFESHVIDVIVLTFQLEIPMSRVISITREKTALIIPNAIGFQTAGKKVSKGR